MVGNLCWVVFQVVQVFLPCCKDERPFGRSVKISQFGLRKKKFILKFQLLMTWIIAYGRFSSGRLAVLNPMKLLRCEHLLPYFQSFESFGWDEFGHWDLSQVRCHCRFAATFCLLEVLARSRNIGFPRINVCETWQSSRYCISPKLWKVRICVCLGEREVEHIKLNRAIHQPFYLPPPTPASPFTKPWCFHKTSCFAGSALTHLNVKTWQADSSSFRSPPAVTLFPWYFAEEAVFSKMAKGSVVTAYEEGTMFSSHTVTSVSTLTTELAQTHFQTTRSLWRSLTKALVPNVLPGPNHLCANDPVVLPVSLRPVSTCDLRAVCTNLSSWGGQLCAGCFSFKASKGNVLVLPMTGPLLYGALPCSLHFLLVHGE